MPRKIRKLRGSFCLLALTAAASFGGPTRAAVIYDPTADFSIANNPNGVWTYGFYNVGGATFTPYTAGQAEPAWHGNANLDAWTQRLYDSASYSVVGKNVSGTLQKESAGGSIEVDPGKLFIHPGQAGEKGAIRFTAPGGGLVDVNATFSASDLSSGTRDVHVYRNGVAVFNGTVNGSKSAAAPAVASLASIPVATGDTIDFAVGFGGDSYNNDATAFVGTVSFNAPEPSALMLGLGVVGLGAVRRRRGR